VLSKKYYEKIKKLRPTKHIEKQRKHSKKQTSFCLLLTFHNTLKKFVLTNNDITSVSANAFKPAYKLKEQPSTQLAITNSFSAWTKTSVAAKLE